MMSEKIKELYIRSNWIKGLALLVLLFGCAVLYVCAGGFPPWAWRFLAQVIPNIPALWQAQGTALLLPLLGLCLLALSLLILWSITIILFFRIIRHIWLASAAKQTFQTGLDVAAMPMTDGDSIADHTETALPPARPVRNAQSQSQESVAPRQRRVAPQQVQPAAQPVQPAARENSYAARRAVGGNLSFTEPSYAPPVPRQRRNTTALPPTPPEQVSQHTTTLPVTRKPTNVTRNTLHLVPQIPEETEEFDELDDATISQEFARLIAKEEEKEERAQSNPSRPVVGSTWGEDDEIDTIPNYEEEQGDDTQDATASQERNDDASARLIVSIGLDPGIARKDSPNEDSLFAIQGMRVTDEGPKPAGLFAVADGMGGHANGREASRSTIHTLSDVIVPTLLRDVSENSAREEETLFLDMLKDGVHRANLSLYRRNRGQQGMMGTTITAAMVMDTTAYVVNVGDSRTYLYRGSEGLSQISRDHSVVARLVECGAITKEQIYTHPKRNQIYRCLGEHATVEMDTFVVPLQANDVLILCSDGLWEMVRDTELEQIVASTASSPRQMSSLLVQSALNHGGADNISVVVVRVAGLDQDKNWML